MKKTALSLPAILAIIAVIAVVIVFLIISMKPAASNDLEAESETEESTVETITCKTGLFKGLSVYPSGGYVGGDTIPAGIYAVTMDPTVMDTEEVEVTVFSTSTANLGSMISDLAFPSCGYFEVKEGQYCSIEGGYAILMEEVDPFTSDNGVYTSNLYLVGRDLPAGIALISGENGSFELFRGGTNRIHLEDSGTIENQTYVELKDGDYINFSGATLYSPEISEQWPETTKIDSNGTYIVGKDLKAGVYKAEPISDISYLNIAEGPAGSDQSKNYERISLSEEQDVELKEGDYVTLKNVQLSSD